MSLSKEQLAVAVAEQPRQPKCTRCRHHGIIVPQKGHVKYCPFLKCACWKCFLITQRTRITAVQRNLKKVQNKGQLARGHTVSELKQAAEGTCPAAAHGGGASASATFGVMCPSTDGASERAATTVWTPHDPRSRAALGGEIVSGLDSGKAPSFASREEGPCTPDDGPYFGEFGQTLPVLPFPFRMSGHYPGSYAPCPNLLLNMQWPPPVPAGFYSDGLHGPLMFPYFHSGALHYPPPSVPGPPADCRQVLFTLQPPPLPEAFQEELMSMQPPQPPLSKHTEQDVDELD